MALVTTREHLLLRSRHACSSSDLRRYFKAIYHGSNKGMVPRGPAHESCFSSIKRKLCLYARSPHGVKGDVSRSPRLADIGSTRDHRQSWVGLVLEAVFRDDRVE